MLKIARRVGSARAAKMVSKELAIEMLWQRQKGSSTKWLNV
jgi:hypothetical protein